MIIDVVDPADGQRYIYIDYGDDEAPCEHPTLTSYVVGGCRCSACREVKRVYSRDYRHRTTSWLLRKQKGAA